MKHRQTWAVTLVALVAAAAIPVWVEAQRGDGAARRRPCRRPRSRGAPAQPAGPVPRLANGKPDLSGLWANPYTPNMALRGRSIPKTREPLKFARQGEAIPGAKAPASGQAPRAPSTCRSPSGA